MLPTVVSVVPVRMQEAWLIFNEAAIRRASGNPNGQQLLQLPRTADIERLPDPKGILRDLLCTASGLHGRRLQRLEISTERIAELKVTDFKNLIDGDVRFGSFTRIAVILLRLVFVRKHR